MLSSQVLSEGWELQCRQDGRRSPTCLPPRWESSRWYWWPPLVGQVKEGGVAAGAEDSNTPAVATLKEEHSAAVATLKEEHSAAAHNTITRVKRQDLITLPTPTDLRKTSTGTDYVDIEWKYEGDQGSVEFLVKVYYSGAERVFAKDQVVRGTSVRVGGLAPSTTYLMSVSAFKALPRGRRATSPDSQLITAKIPDLVLSPPSNLRVTDSSRDLINLEWQYDGNQNDVEFLVNVYYSGGVLLRDLPVKGRTSVTVDGLTPDTDYTFSVKAFKALPRGLRAFSDSSPTITGTTRVTPRPTPRPQPPRTPPPSPPPPIPRPQPPETTTSPSILRPDTRPPAVGCTHGMCSCPAPNQHFCVACDRLSLCERVEDESVCSIEPAAMGVNMTVTVLSCGPQVTLNLRDFVRSDKGLLCGSATGVPVDTVVMAECWRSATYLSQCHADGKWHPYGRHQTQAPSSQHLCQPHAVNSLDRPQTSFNRYC
ncbi:Collagen alpha-1(XIV) chain-like [Homarus americanus]|uniref:Collagen alpha-1(XIV) chain-like n=1 Tax=Homarus americanus TaxID=6706 RepID=A0A8J5N018_HOMAM|nr:Collagen alpha-1(XIV) chain-like [Homarus americanus]